MTSTFSEILDEALEQVRTEVIRAYTKHNHNFGSAHEGYAIMLEEVDELWDEIKRDNGYSAAARAEATQVAATAVRYMLDVAREQA